MTIGESLHVIPPVFAPMRPRALVVDQDRMDLHAYADVLRNLGFEVNPFGNCREALRWLDEASVDFVFVSQGVGSPDWREVVERTVARDRHTPVVVTTRKLDVGCYLEAMYLGATDYVEKPLPPAQIERLVTTFLRPHAAKRTQSA